MASAAAAQEQPRKLKILILSGANNHDWRKTTPALKEILESCGRFVCDITYEPAKCTLETFKQYDALLSDYNGPRWGEAAEQGLLQYVREGGGFVVIHAANNAFPDWPEYEKLIGGAWRKGSGHGAKHSYVVKIVNHEHPITRDMPDFQHSIDELYHRLRMQENITLLATAYSDPKTRGTGRDEPMFWTVNYGKGRVFQVVMGHDLRAHDVPFKTVVRRGTEWAATGEVTIPIPDNWPAPGTDLCALQGFLSKWFVIGPWPNKGGAAFEQTLPPEQGVDLGAKYTVTVAGEQREIAWKFVNGDPGDGHVDLERAVGRLDNVCAFVYAEVTVPQAQDVLLKLGSDDGVVVYLNGKRIHAINVTRGLKVDQDVVQARLEAGVNKLLFKVLQGRGRWGLVARITDREGQPIKFTLREGQ